MTNQLFCEELGPADRTTIVFLHGGGVGGWMWHKVAGILSPHYHCLLPDLPEQGNSREVGPFTHSFAVDCVADLIRSRAHGGKAHVVGLSEGAQVAVAMLARSPELIDHAVVSSAILRPLPGVWMYSRGVFTWSYRWFMAPLRNCDWWIRLNMRYSAGIGDEYFPEFKRSFQDLSEGGFVNLMYEAMHFSQPQGLEKANLPVLVAAGEHEYPQMKDSAHELLAVLPNARGVWITAGQPSTLASEHNWALTDPALFAAAVRAWIEDKELPGGLRPIAAGTG
jgi:pimeloyl-ACP methyl ester carboxylesterase